MSVHKKLFIFCILFFVCNLFFVSFVNAKYTAENAEHFLNEANKGAGVEQTDVITLSSRIVKVGLTAVSLVFFILIFYAGYRWLMARGEEEKIKKARDTIIASIIGLVIVVGSYAITNFVVNRLIGKQVSGAPETVVGDPTKPQGCCLDEFETAGGFIDSLSSTHNWHSSITDFETCKTIGNTCDNDQVCGEAQGELWDWVEGVTDLEKCMEIADTKATH